MPKACFVRSQWPLTTRIYSVHPRVQVGIFPRYNEIPPWCSWDIPFTRIGQGGYMYRQEAWKQYAPGYGLQWHINWLLLNPVSAALTINKREGILMRLDHVVKYDFSLSLFQEDGVNLQEKQDWTVSDSLTSSLNPKTNLTALPLSGFISFRTEERQRNQGKNADTPEALFQSRV